MEIAVPQQKTFYFSSSVPMEQIDKEINDWRVEVTQEGNQPAPNAPNLLEDENGGRTFVCMFAKIMNIDLLKKK